jgi:N-acetylneuraminic acid mutarotase
MGGNSDYGYLNIVTEYDPGADIMTVKSPMPTKRAYYSASVVGGKIYVFGGYNETGTFLDTVEIYDPSTDNWSTGTSMTVGRRSLASAAYGKYIYLFGGFNNEGGLSLVEEYDTKTNTWTNCQGECPSMSEARYSHTATTFNNKIHLLGGVFITSNHIVFTPPIRPEAMPWIPLLLLED